mmetsp:Transcript_6016/g.14843  ORF Transcript_6016/g.14843 Transcript_6016/m.14843 type:complete len:363 (+) Transcript_6016:486-1574(+)
MQLPLLLDVVLQHRTTQGSESEQGLGHMVAMLHPHVPQHLEKHLQGAAQRLAFLLEQPGELVHLLHESQPLQGLAQLDLLVELLRKVDRLVQGVEECHDPGWWDVLVVLRHYVLHGVNQQEMHDALDDDVCLAEGQLGVASHARLDEEELRRHAVAKQLQDRDRHLLPRLRRELPAGVDQQLLEAFHADASDGLRVVLDAVRDQLQHVVEQEGQGLQVRIEEPDEVCHGREARRRAHGHGPGSRRAVRLLDAMLQLMVNVVEERLDHPVEDHAPRVLVEDLRPVLAQAVEHRVQRCPSEIFPRIAHEHGKASQNRKPMRSRVARVRSRRRHPGWRRWRVGSRLVGKVLRSLGQEPDRAKGYR